MTGRYPPPSYDPRDRDRSRSPPRFGERRPSGPYNASFQQNQRNQGPPPRGYPDGDIRPQSSFPPARDRRDFDRRGPRPPSPSRPRSPPLRDLDPRREPAPDSAYNDRPLPLNFARGGFSASRGRGRGAPDFDSRDRYRRPEPEDRFRPRSPPPRWGRSDSREGRDEWRGANRPNRPDEDRWLGRERDNRDREPAWRAGQRFDSRSSNDGSGPPTPVIPSQPQAPALERPPLPESGRPPLDHRASIASAHRSSDQPEQGDSTRPRAGSPPHAPIAPSVPSFSFAFNRSNAASTDPSPQVSKPTSPETAQKPFASIPNASAANSGLPAQTSGEAAVKQPVQGPTSTLSKPPPESPVIGAPSVASTVSIPPQSPKVQRAPIEPPRGPRALEQSPVPIPTEPRHSRSSSQSSAVPAIPTGPAALRRDERPSYTNFSMRDRGSISGPSSVASQPQNLPPPSWQRQSQPFQSKTAPSETGSVISSTADSTSFPDRKPPTGPAQGRPDVNALGIPTGPRAASVKQQSPSIASAISSAASPRIPTAPRADRVPPTGPRADSDRASFSSSRSHGTPAVTTPRIPPTAPRMGSWSNWRSPGARDPASQARDIGMQSGQALGAAQSGSPVKQEERDVKSNMINQPERNDKGQVDAFGDPVEHAVDSSSDDDDVMDLDEDDFEGPRERFERTKARLEAQYADLSDRRYRMTSPFEQIARISKITAEDMPPPGELTPEPEAPELDDEEGSGPTDEVDQELMTPDEEVGEGIAMERGGRLRARVRQPRREPSPEIINLPYLLKDPLTTEDALRDHVAQQEQNKSAIAQYLERVQAETADLELDALNTYAERYRQMKLTEKLVEEARAERERIEREQSHDGKDDADNTANPPETPVTESRRLHKFSSEYDIQKVLKESEEMARQQREKEEKDAQRARDAVEKQAMTPALMDEGMIRRSMFINTNHLRRPEQLIDVYGFEPPPDDFTEEEHEIFLAAFKERPKKWGEIAELLPGRSHENCIHHYYAYKWDGRFRETKRGKRKPTGRARGGKAGARVRGAALMADLGQLDDDLSGPVEQTATGRPRRAAAVRGTATPALVEQDSDNKANVATPARRGVKGDGSEPAAEKGKRKRKTATGETAAKRVKSQSTPAAGPAPSVPPMPMPHQAMSPVKTDRELFRAGELSREDMARMDDANLLAGLHAGHRQIRDTMFPAEPYYQPPPSQEAPERARAAASHSQRQAASSYWSVTEQQDFTRFLEYFGPDFGAIAAQMGTKTQTMVKNHYQRKLEGEEKEKYLRTAEEAVARINRGEDRGPVPTSTPIIKRRYDNQTLPTARYSEHGEVGDVNDAVMALQAAGQARMAAQPLPTSLTSKGAPPPAAQIPGPRMGFFSETRGSAQQPSSRPLTQPLQVHHAQAPARGQQSDNVNPRSAWYQDLVQEQQRALGLQKEQEQRSSEHVPQAPHLSGYQRMEQHPEDRGPMHMPPMYRPGSDPMRRQLGSPALPASAPPPFPPPHHPGQIPSPTKAAGFRPSSVPAGSPAEPPSHAPPPAEPRKSNILSILNSEPAEDHRSIKRLSDHSLHRAQSPAPRHPTPTGNGPRHRTDTIGSAGTPRGYYERPGASTPVAAPPQPYESTWGQISAPRRDYDWPPRSAPPPPPQSNSPGPGILERDRGYYQPRAGPLGSLGGPPRTTQTPPPGHHQYGRTSRGSSFSAPGPPPTQQLPPSQYPPPQRDQRPYPAPPYASQQHSPNPPPPLDSRRTSREEDLRAQDRWAFDERERATALDRERERDAFEQRYRPSGPPSLHAPPAPNQPFMREYERPGFDRYRGEEQRRAAEEENRRRDEEWAQRSGYTGFRGRR